MSGRAPVVRTLAAGTAATVLGKTLDGWLALDVRSPSSSITFAWPGRTVPA